jgi:hypothetical protein
MTLPVGYRLVNQSPFFLEAFAIFLKLIYIYGFPFYYIIEARRKLQGI